MADSKLHLLSDRVKEYVLGRDNEELEELLMLEGDEFAQAAKDAYKSRTRYGYSRSSGQSRSGRVSSRDGYSMGKEAGQNMSINKGINGSQPKGNIQ